MSEEEYWFTWNRCVHVLIIFSITDVRNSKGKFDKIRWKFMINPAPIRSKSSLNEGGSRRTQDFSFKSLNSFMIQSRVKKNKRGYIGF